MGKVEDFFIQDFKNHLSELGKDIGHISNFILVLNFKIIIIYIFEF